MAIKNDFTCFKGEAFTATGTQQPSPTNITGWTIVFTLKQEATDAAPLLTKPCTLVTPASGVYQLALTHAETNLAAGTYDYDIQRTNVGFETVLSYGRFVVVQEVLY